MSVRNVIQAAAGAGGGDKLYVEDVFSTYLYTGTGSGTTVTVNNGIDLTGEGGLVWRKLRTGAFDHDLFDTARGNNTAIQSNATNPQNATYSCVFTSSGFQDATGWGTTANLVSWTFRKAPKFFDIVTWSGDATAGRSITHNLGSTPGAIIIKNISTTRSWVVWHRDMGSSGGNANTMYLNLTSAASATNMIRNVTSTTFDVSADGEVNGNSANSYVAYVFAHDAGGFGDAGDQSVVKCGSVTATGGNVEVNLGWEPQWVLVKNASASEGWRMFDNMRGITTSSTKWLLANTSGAETDESGWNELTSTGFKLLGWGSSGNNYVYIAIRRGPMKTPEVGTSVFTPVLGSATVAPAFNTGIVTDLGIFKNKGSTGANYWGTRLIQGTLLQSSSTAAEAADSPAVFDYMNGFYNSTPGTGWIGYGFQRAPGFFDVVCYTGTGSNRTVSHNLGVAPELMIVKIRNTAVTANWQVYHKDVGATKYLELNTTAAAQTSATRWNDTAPTSSVFSIGTANGVNYDSTATYVAYLFATVAGVSKVGTYTGTGATGNQINCGFTNGARFILIKRTDTIGNWAVFDTARGIVDGNDPAIFLNSTTAENTANDFVDTYSAGFELGSSTTFNASGGIYIFLAIA